MLGACGIDCAACCNYLAGDCKGCMIWCDDSDCECEIVEVAEWEIEGQEG